MGGKLEKEIRFMEIQLGINCIDGSLPYQFPSDINLYFPDITSDRSS